MLVATDGHEGVAAVPEHGSAIDLVLLDMTMPGPSGDQALEEMRRIEPGVRVLLTSEYARPEAADPLPAENLAGFIQKPYGGDELLRRVGEAPDGRRGR